MNARLYDSRGAWVAEGSLERVLKKSMTNDNPTHKKWYTKVPWTLTRYYVLSPKISFVGKLSSQYSSDNSLPVSEQFSLGGRNNLAYESASFSGAEGYSFGTEVQYRPDWGKYFDRYIPKGWGGGDVRGVLSYQQGSVTYYDAEGKEMGDSGYVGSLTAGVKFRLTSHMTGELNVPLALGGHSDREKKSFLFVLRGTF